MGGGGGLVGGIGSGKVLDDDPTSLPRLSLVVVGKGSREKWAVVTGKGSRWKCCRGQDSH